ncbi:MAG: hypothetical protein OXD54_09225 [Candidatus Poribacteria bacterium]|nr:hypothetical protein [Candidatus Poribacteria bacterium]
MKSIFLHKNHSKYTLYWINKLKIYIITLLLITCQLSAHAAKPTDFFPKESILYIQANELNDVYYEISMSENWKNTVDLLLSDSNTDGIRQGMQLVENIIGTDLSGVIETVGYQIGLAMWQRDVDNPHGGFVVHSGGNLAELQRLTKILTGFMGMSGGRLSIDAGEYRKVKYNTLQMPDILFTYGFVRDFLVVGIGENSFQNMIDTYRKKSESIKKNESFVETIDKLGSDQINLYVDLRRVIPFIEEMDAEARIQLEAFSKMGFGLNLLEKGPLLQLYTKFDPNIPESYISRFLKEGQELKSLKGMSGDEDLFIAAAPGILEAIWELVQDAIQNNESDDAYAFITYLEGIMNLNFEDDFIKGLTGEIALTVDDLPRFNPEAVESLDIDFENTLQIDANNVHTQGGIIFNSANPSKWDKVENSVSNLQNTSVSTTDYKGTDVSVFASNIYYAEKNGLSLLSFSENQMYAMVDGLENKKKISYLKQVPKKPLAFFKINIMKWIELVDDSLMIDNEEEIDDIALLLAWITVKDNEAMLEIAFPDKESPIELFIKLLPYIATGISG